MPGPDDFGSVSFAYSGYTWPDVFALVSLLVSLLGYSWPNDFAVVSHLSPCLSPCLDTLGQMIFAIVSHLSPSCGCSNWCFITDSRGGPNSKAKFGARTLGTDWHAA